MKKTFLLLMIFFCFVGSSYGQYVFEVSTEIDGDPASPTYKQCIGWTSITTAQYSWEFEADGVTKKRFAREDSDHITSKDLQHWLVPVEFTNYDPAVDDNLYMIKFNATDVGILPSATVIPIQGSGKPGAIKKGIHMYWFRVKIDLSDYSDPVPVGILVIKTGQPTPGS